MQLLGNEGLVDARSGGGAQFNSYHCARMLFSVFAAWSGQSTPSYV